MVSIPLIFKMVPPNRWYGFRIPQTLSNQELWFRANWFAGWAFLVASMASATVFISAPEVASSYGALVLVVPIGVALAASLIYLRKASASDKIR